MSTDPRDLHAQMTSVLAVARERAAHPSACMCPEDTDHWFDRSICPDPCGSMHDICNECGHPKGGCALDPVRAQNTNVLHDLLDLLAEAHAPVVDDEGNAWCDTCFDENTSFSTWSWPCRFYTAAEKVVDTIADGFAEPTYEMAFA